MIYIEFRNSGISGVFKNFQIEKASIATDCSPYRENTYPIPQTIPGLDGYGWGIGSVYNYVDYENKKYYKYVNRVDLGTLEYYQDAHVSFMTQFEGFKNTNSPTIAPNFICSKYETKSEGELWGHKDLTGVSASSSSNTYIYINDNSFSDVYSFRESLQGVYLYYELAEPIVTDISDIIKDTFQEPINVEVGDSLTFKNSNGDGYQVAVPSDIEYTVKLSEVAS